MPRASRCSRPISSSIRRCGERARDGRRSRSRASRWVPPVWFFSSESLFSFDGRSFTDRILLSRNFRAIGCKSSVYSDCTQSTIHLIPTGFLLQRELDSSTLHGKPYNSSTIWAFLPFCCYKAVHRVSAESALHVYLLPSFHTAATYRPSFCTASLSVITLCTFQCFHTRVDASPRSEYNVLHAASDVYSTVAQHRRFRALACPREIAPILAKICARLLVVRARVAQFQSVHVPVRLISSSTWQIYDVLRFTETFRGVIVPR